MKRVGWLVAGLVVSVIVQLSIAEEQPKPGPEHKKLGYFVGTWSAEGEAKENPFGPGGKFKTTDHCEWFEGGFAVVCRSEGTCPRGRMKGLGVMGYNADQKVYTYYGVDNSGMVMTSIPQGTLQGDTWTYNDESEMGGKTIKSRYVIKELSPTSYSFKWEMLGEDGKWMGVMDGKTTKK